MPLYISKVKAATVLTLLYALFIIYYLLFIIYFQLVIFKKQKPRVSGFMTHNTPKASNRTYHFSNSLLCSAFVELSIV